ncbi:MAG: shikimate kinase [Candidatus Methanogaster sp.]|uniref:Shikimate kinase n=1 Tax=Candidatus Methanogaster sp. TaxID=3386292 RepID=A0AC61KZM1_9EURY|nr:MAG: shikimate kinase [ANME-2 cluster archaeon]
MHGHGYANGAGTIVNAIAIWKGAAFCIDLATTADVELDECTRDARNAITGGEGVGRITGRIENADTADTALITRCVSLVLDRFGYRCDGAVTTRSEIPIARGLKSSSAAANATVLATLDAIGETLPRLEVVSMGVRAALDVGVTITGAFDDACASALGGIVITDNRNMELVERFEYDSDVLIYLPEEKAFTADTDVTRSKAVAPLVEIAYQLALDHDFENAMTLNGLLYCAALGFDTEIVMSALKLGVLGVSLSGTGSAYTALVGRDQIKELKGCWSDMGGSVIQTRIVNKL